MAYETPIIRGIRLVATYQLPDRLRCIFKFPLFNAVQSKCFKTVYENDDNFVLSAPTGSGKTAILELAICRLATNRQNQDFKIIYQAPTKSLCSERHKDWQAKFSHLGLKCAELTGDTDIYHLKQVQTADIIVTTPEKWDSMTRRWKDHRKLLDLIKLFLIDEVHILKEDRGANLEAAVSRMKSLGSNVRFVALSATVPNSEDIAAWLGANNRVPGMPAHREVFDESFRPVKLQKQVYGIQANGKNDFAFDQICNKQLREVISNYSVHRKPIMVFCMTRRSTEVAALELATWWMESIPEKRFWNSASHFAQVEDQNLRKCMPAGVAFHHAGLTLSDRNAVESEYLNSRISVICCTSTLAVGVNLPCHLVVVKNTVTYQAEGCKEYSDLEVIQMLGRAGRPQFDDSAVAVIMTRLEKVERYERMVSGQEVLESRFHLHLTEHLNAEICLGTVRDMESARIWLKGTFLYIRLQKHSDYYRLHKDISKQKLADVVDDICTQSLEQLDENQLIEKGKEYRSTEFGHAMSRYYVQFDTMQIFLGLQPKAKISEILSALSQASEFKPLRIRSSEKTMFKALNESPSIKFPIQVDLAQSAHKVSLIVQATLGGLDQRQDKRFAVNSQQFQTEAALVFQHIQRFIRCIVDCQLELEDAVAMRNALDLSRSLSAKAWDDSPLQMLQIDKLGPVGVRKLASANIRNVEELEDQDAQRIDMLLSRNPPFGTNLLKDVQKNFPKLRVSLKLLGKTVGCSGLSLDIVAEIAFLNQSPPLYFKKKAVYIVVLAEISDGRVAHFCRISAQKLGSGQNVRFNANLTASEQFITCYVSCDDIERQAGTQRQATLKTAIASTAFLNVKAADSQHHMQPTTFKNPSSSKTSFCKTRGPDFEGIGDEDFLSIEHANFNGCNVPTKVTEKERKQVIPTRINGANRDPQQVNQAWHPIQLKNGKWECQHVCKDKSSCKHFCCREGLDKPPQRPKRLSVKPGNDEGESKSAKPELIGNLIIPGRSAANESNRTEGENHPNSSKKRLYQQAGPTPEDAFDFSDDFDDIDDLCSDVQPYGTTPNGSPMQEDVSQRSTFMEQLGGCRKNELKSNPAGYEVELSSDRCMTKMKRDASEIQGSSPPSDWQQKTETKKKQRLSSHEVDLARKRVPEPTSKFEREEPDAEQLARSLKTERERPIADADGNKLNTSSHSIHQSCLGALDERCASFYQSCQKQTSVGTELHGIVGSHEVKTPDSISNADFDTAAQDTDALDQPLEDETKAWLLAQFGDIIEFV